MTCSRANTMADPRQDSRHKGAVPRDVGPSNDEGNGADSGESKGAGIRCAGGHKGALLEGECERRRPGGLHLQRTRGAWRKPPTSRLAALLADAWPLPTAQREDQGSAVGDGTGLGNACTLVRLLRGLAALADGRGGGVGGWRSDWALSSSARRGACGWWVLLGAACCLLAQCVCLSQCPMSMLASIEHPTQKFPQCPAAATPLPPGERTYGRPCGLIRRSCVDVP